MARKLFCEINPITYAISLHKMRLMRNVKDFFSNTAFAKTKGDKLPISICKHNSLIRRKLGNVDMTLQENKAVNLSISAPKVNGIIIRPNETLSFWKLIGRCSKRKGYKEGLTIFSGNPSKGVGGGMCQFTNLMHWLVLHSPLDIVEYHHHDDIDMFPDYGRQVPFGCGTSIMYNYLDYRVKNNTDTTFQFLVYTTETHLCGELKSDKPLSVSYHIIEEDLHFVKVEEQYYRKNTIIRRQVDKNTGKEMEKEIIKQSDAKVLYDEEFIPKDLIRTK